MKTASLFKNGCNQAVRLPKEFEFKNVTEVEIIKENGRIIIQPKKPSWESYFKIPRKVDNDFLVIRQDVIEDRGFEFE